MAGWLVVVLAVFAYPLYAFSRPLADLKAATLLALSAQATRYQRLAERQVLGRNVVANNDEETASVLCQAGSWIKYLNPKRADRFYKALVRRCRQTSIGQAADQLRWFPILNAEGKLKQPIPVTDTASLQSKTEI